MCLHVLTHLHIYIDTDTPVPPQTGTHADTVTCTQHILASLQVHEHASTHLLTLVCHVPVTYFQVHKHSDTHHVHTDRHRHIPRTHTGTDTNTYHRHTHRHRQAHTTDTYTDTDTHHVHTHTHTPASRPAYGLLPGATCETPLSSRCGSPGADEGSCNAAPHTTYSNELCGSILLDTSRCV